MDFALAALRGVVGGLFVGHGLQKLAGKFGGYGLEGTGQFFAGLGLKPGKANAAVAGASETAGGALLATGLFTPVGASMITAPMTVAIKEVHAAKGPWNSDGGYEYNAVLIAVAFTLAAAGPGRWSLDRLLGTARSGLPVAIAAVGSGAAGGLAVTALAKRNGQDDAAATSAPTTTAQETAEPVGVAA